MPFKNWKIRYLADQIYSLHRREVDESGKVCDEGWVYGLSFDDIEAVRAYVHTGLHVIVYCMMCYVWYDMVRYDRVTSLGMRKRSIV